MDSLILETAIGLVFVFAAFAALVSLLTEAITRFIGLRGEYLMRGVRSLVDGESEFKLSIGDLFARTPKEPQQGAPSKDAEQEELGDPFVTRIVNHPLISTSADQSLMPADPGNARLTNRLRRRLPSYISGRSFAAALLGAIVPDASGRTTIGALTARVNSLPPHLKMSLLPLLTAADNDLAEFRKRIESWYDDHMARVSGWYKRHVRWITLALGAMLVLVFNLSAVEVARSLYTDEALRGSVVTQAAAAAQCDDKEPSECLGAVREEIDDLRASGLPIGWGTVADCAAEADECSWLEERGLTDPNGDGVDDFLSFTLVLLGWALMVIALLPGARFWFDALGRLGSLRATGPKPSTDET